MNFSPLVLLRQPVYNLSHLDAFAIDLDIEITEASIEKLRQKFLSFIQSKDLLLSLPFSSKVLYQAIPHYEFHAEIKIRKKEKQNERAFTKYLLRMALNASPLAAFAKTQFCNWEGKVIPNEHNFSMSLSLSQRKEFFDLCYCDVGLQHLMRHRLNPSLKRVEGGFTYIMMDVKTENLVEIATDAQFDALYNTLKDEDFTFEEFVAQCDYDVNEFLEAQLISFSYPIYSDHVLVAAIVASINERHQLKFEVEDIVGRHLNEMSSEDAIKHQSRWTKQLASYSKKLSVSLQEKAHSERIFYLSSGHTNSKKPEFDQTALGTELINLVQLIGNVVQPASTVEDQESTSLNEVTPLYHLEKVTVEQLQQDCFRIDLSEMDAGGRYLDIGVMLNHSGAKQPFLINITTASGKFFAPSLSLVNDGLKEQIGEWVKNGKSNRVNLKDTSLHSKNSAHPFIAEQDGFGLDFHTPIKERVKLDFKNDKIIKELDETEAIPVNLGIQAINERSQLYQSYFSKGEDLPNIPVFANALQDKYAYALQKDVVVSPSILAKHFIIARKKWTFMTKAAVGDYSTDMEKEMLLINNWRKELQIPRFVSVSIDNTRSNYLDFFNPWSVDNFIRSLKKMQSKCVFEDLAIDSDMKGLQVVETYFELRQS